MEQHFPAGVEYADDRDKAQVGIEIHSGKNRIVRRIAAICAFSLYPYSEIVITSSPVLSFLA